MDFASSVILGIVQGVTEFLPISSSGHLVLGQFFLGIREPELFFDVMLHVATLLVVLWYFRHDIAEAVFEAINAVKSQGDKPNRAPEASGARLRLHGFLQSEVVKVAVATIPVAVAGFFGRSFIEHLFSNPRLVAFNLIITGTFLISTFFVGFRRNHSSESADTVSWAQALLVGIFQVLALAPGISRSGVTISVALLSGCSRQSSARFSFFLFIPAILGAFILEVTKVNFSTMDWGIVAVGFLSALISGYIALRWLMGLIRKGAFYRFAFYCWAVGVLTLFFAG